MKARTRLALAFVALITVLAIAVGTSLAASSRPKSTGQTSVGSTGSGGVVAPDRPIGVPAVPPCPAGAELFPCPSPVPLPGAPNTVTVTGTGTVTSQPDQAVINLGVQTQASDAADALRENSDRMQAVMRALRALGIAADDISTYAVNLYPNYDPDGSGTNGYAAENDIAVTVRDLSLVGRAIDAAVGAGANLTSGVSFTLSDDNRGTADALRRAVADARSKAEALADAAGATLGDVVSITESSGGFPPPIFADARGAAESTPVSPPQIQMSVSVTVVWSLVTPA
jgi:hypothetical protein